MKKRKMNAKKIMDVVIILVAITVVIYLFVNRQTTHNGNRATQESGRIIRNGDNVSPVPSQVATPDNQPVATTEGQFIQQNHVGGQSGTQRSN